MRYSLSCDGVATIPDGIRAAAEIHRELGPDYDKAVVESFLERLGPEIDARVDTRVVQEIEARVGRPRGKNFDDLVDSGSAVDVVWGLGVRR